MCVSLVNFLSIICQFLSIFFLFNFLSFFSKRCFVKSIIYSIVVAIQISSQSFSQVLNEMTWSSSVSVESRSNPRLRGQGSVKGLDSSLWLINSRVRFGPLPMPITEREEGGKGQIKHLLSSSALWADALYKSKCPSVCFCLSICLSVCSLLKYRFSLFGPPLPEVRCPIFLVIQNPWGKVMERIGPQFEHFSLEVVWNCQKKKLVLADFALQNKVETTLPNGLETSGQRAYR